MPRSSFLAVTYATDEDCFTKGGADFGVIVPTSNVMASGSDGVFSAGNLWALASASNDFAGQGCTPGTVVQLAGPMSVFKRPQFLAVDSVTGGSLCALRRCGMAAHQGVPPAPAGGLTGVAFQVLTLYPQIENAAFKLNEQFAVDPNIATRSPADIYDERVFRELTILYVYYTQYMNINRAKAGDFADKQLHYKNEFESALASASLRWGKQGTSQPPTSRWSTRVGR